MELPVETYWGRSNAEVSTPRLSMSRSFLVKTPQVVFFVCLVCFNGIVLWLEIMPCKQYIWFHSFALKLWNSSSLLLTCSSISSSYRNSESVLKQNKSMKTLCFIQTTSRTKITLFSFFFFPALSEWRPQALSCSVYANSKGRTGPSDSVAWVDVTRTWPWQQWKPGWAIVTRRLHPSSVWNILR